MRVASVGTQADRLPHEPTVGPGRDHRARQFAAFVRAVAVAAASLGGLKLAAGVIYAEPRAILLGVISVLFGVWLIRISRYLGSLGRDTIVNRIAFVTLAVVAASSILEPTLAIPLAVAALLPAAVVLPFLRGRAVLHVLVAAGAVGLGAVAAGMLLPTTSHLPETMNAVFAVMTLVAAYALVLAFMWEASRRLTATADDLSSIVAMSVDLAETLDMHMVGDRIVRHISLALRSTESAICYWDRPTDQLVTLACYPLERRLAFDDSYPLSDYPATRAVLEGGQPVIVDAADPSSDPNEVAYLQSIGMRSMAMVPLVAAGTSIGTLEMMSPLSGAFGPRDLELAMLLAGEGAMALENARLYEAIKDQALHDGLTRLANRVLFRELVGAAIGRATVADGPPFAILFIDLDDFKVLNDTLGHARGDDVLVAVAERLAEILRPGDTAARLGGDEFAVLLQGVADEDAARTVAIRVADALREPMEVGGIVTTVAASIGVAMSGSFADSADDLLRNADMAMYAAKSSSRGRAQLFHAGLRADAADRNDLVARLRGVEARGELWLAYQPVVELATGSIVGLEALVRWLRPDGRLLMPDQFITLAEQTGDIVPMGRWILREACRQLRAWQIAHDRPTMCVGVNLSARQFQEPDLVETVRMALADADLEPSSLVLEITESSLMHRTTGTIDKLTALRSLGVHLAIDDFGTGYSSLSYLERFPVDSLKIDRSFISEMSPNGERPAVARAIVELGRTLGLDVVAEGIEQLDQAEWLMSLGCAFGQGYLFSKPLDVEAMGAYLIADGVRHAPPRRLRLVSGDH